MKILKFSSKIAKNFRRIQLKKFNKFYEIFENLRIGLNGKLSLIEISRNHLSQVRAKEIPFFFKSKILQNF